jgi:nitrite reductase (NADH) small subunit
MSDAIKVAEVSDLPPGQCKTVMAGDRELALANVAGKFFACDNVCPHQGGPLGEGMIDGTIITCPWHGWRFDVATGKSPVIPGVQIDVFECTVDGNDVKVRI